MKQISARLKTSSAVVPAILCALVCMPIGAAGLVLADEDLRIVFGAVLIMPMTVALFQIMFFTFIDRDRLHNEEHLERKMMIDNGYSVIGDNRTNKQIVIENDNVSPKKLKGKGGE